MRLLFEFGHPAHVHTFKYSIIELKKKGHKIKIAVRDRENMVKSLLDIYGFEYEEMVPTVTGMVRKGIGVIKNDWKLYQIAKRFNPHIFINLGSAYSPHVSFLTGKKNIHFTDSEPTRLQIYLGIWFTDSIITPDLFSRSLPKKKHIRVKAYKELGYLHPNRFQPAESVLDDLGVSKDEKFVVLRFGAFDASHDLGITGFTPQDKIKLLNTLKKYAKVFISSEKPLRGKFKKYELPTTVEKIHDVLNYTSLLVSDTQTSTTEAACLATPAIRSNKWVGPNDMTNFIELENDYGLIFNIRDPDKAIRKAVELIKKDNLKNEWRKKREKLLKNKIDITSFFVWFIGNYPESHWIMKRNPEYQNRFR